MKIRSQFQHSNLYTPPSGNCANLTQSRPISHEETLEILNSMKKTMCDIDLCNIHFLMEFKEILLSAWTKIIYTSLLNGSFLQPWKKAVVRPGIKSSKSDRELKNYQPIINLSFISKSIEKAALLQLSTYFEDQNLLPTYQSTYHKHHSTETKVLNICDEILQNTEHSDNTSTTSLNTALVHTEFNLSMNQCVT